MRLHAILAAFILAGCNIDASAIGAIERAIGGSPQQQAAPTPSAAPTAPPTSSTKVKVKTETTVEVETGGTISAPSPDAASLTFKGAIQAFSRHRPVVGASSLSGCLALDDRISAFMDNLGKDAIPLVAAADVTTDGRYTLSVPDLGDACLAVFVVGWDDNDGDGAFTPHSSEFTAGVYLYLRQNKTVGFTLGVPSRYGKTAYPNEANFEFLM